MKKKKILFVITKSVWGGAQKYVRDLAVNLPKDEFETAVAAGGQGKLFEEIKKEGVNFYEIKNFKRDVSFISDILAFFEVLKILRNLKPDIIHVNSSKAGGIAGFAFLIYKIFKFGNRVSKNSETRFPKKLITNNYLLKSIFTVHGWAFKEKRPKWQIYLIKIVSRLTCVFYDKVICVSEFDRQAAIKNKIALERKLVTVHNGIDTDKEIFLDKEKAREKIFNFQPAYRTGRFPIFNQFSISKFSNSEIIVGTIGEFTKNKGQRHLIEEISKIRNSKFEIRCLILGWGEEKENLKSQISNLKLEDKVFLVEGLSPAAPYLKAFDIFVLPSLKEGLPYTLLEAGLAGIPVIATDVGGIPEIIEHEKTGLLVSPADSDKLANAIKKLLEDKNLAEKLAGNLRQKIISEFSLENMVRETLNIYGQITAKTVNESSVSSSCL